MLNRSNVSRCAHFLPPNLRWIFLVRETKRVPDFRCSWRGSLVLWMLVDERHLGSGLMTLFNLWSNLHSYHRNWKSIFVISITKLCVRCGDRIIIDPHKITGDWGHGSSRRAPVSTPQDADSMESSGVRAFLLTWDHGNMIYHSDTVVKYSREVHYKPLLDKCNNHYLCFLWEKGTIDLEEQ